MIERVVSMFYRRTAKFIMYYLFIHKTDSTLSRFKTKGTEKE